MRKFTPDEDEYLKANYLTVPAKKMSRILGRSESAARQRMKLLGIVVPPEVIDVFRKQSQIKPGTTPPNKGKKQSEYMTTESILKTVATRFKKGNVPANTRYDGAERISKDGYVEVRVRKGKFKLKHRVIWERLHGEIPTESILVCLGEDITDCRPENWECITMKENMGRNSGATHLPDNMIATYLATSSRKVDKELKKEILNHPELIKAKRTQLLLNRKIKQHGQKQNS